MGQRHISWSSVHLYVAGTLEFFLSIQLVAHVCKEATKMLLLLLLFIEISAAFNLTSMPMLAILDDPEPITTKPPLLVKTEYGLIQGLTLPAYDGETVTAFLGVPYAEPPLGQLRFQPPQDPVKWNNVYKADKEPASCMQMPDVFFGDFDGAKQGLPANAPNEDCLYLNIYVPDLKVRVHHKSNQARLDQGHILEQGLPVLVWIHGGEFSTGSAFRYGDGPTGTPNDPRQLASIGKIMVISIQYRLGSFGYLFMDDDQAPGNVGLLDVEKALKWIKTNILAFGGDPSSITVAGQDAGANLALLVKHLDDQLFDKLILHSGGLEHPWSYISSRQAFRRSLSLAALVGCPMTGASKQEVIDCLKAKPAEEIVAKEFGVVSQAGLNFRPFVPTRQVPKILDLKDTPILLGTNSNEGSKAAMYFLPQIFPNEELAKPALNLSDFNSAISKIFHDFPDELIETIQFQYTNWTLVQDATMRFNQILNLLGDYQYNCPVSALADQLASKSKVFKYVFDVRNPLDAWPTWSGVKHGDELDYLFAKPLLRNQTLEHQSISLFMIEAWSNFVKYGNPNGIQRALHTVGWPAYQDSSKHVLQISTFADLNQYQHLFQIFTPIIHENKEENCAFWNGLVPKLLQLHAKECKVKRASISDSKKFLPLTETSTISSTSTSTSTVSTTSSTVSSTTISSSTTQFLPGFSQKVSFSMNVDHSKLLEPKGWKFYNAPGNDPILLASKPQQTSSSTTTLEPLSSKRKPTWRPQIYDPFSRFPYFRMDDEHQENNKKSLYFPME